MINNINKMLNEKLTEKNTIYVLRGFNSIFDDLSLNVKHAFDLKITENLFNLENSVNKIMNLALNDLNGDEPLVCLYEEMFMVIKSNLFGLVQAKNYKLIIIDIGLFDAYYPGFVSQNNNYIVQKFDQDTIESNVLQQIYADCSIERDNLVISYNDIDTDLIFEYKRLFVSHSEDIKHYIFSDVKELDLFDNSTPQSFIYVFNAVVRNGINTINYTNTEHNTTNLSFKFVSILNSFGINVILKSSIKSVKIPSFYENYLEILHRKNKQYNFLDIEIYKDPFNSNEIQKVNQSVIIDAIYQNILKAKSGEYPRDIFVTAPTGAGKSILFQIPAIMAAEKNNLVTIVVSPLIGLMNDQVSNIKSMTDCAATINSDFTPFEKENIKERIKNGQYSILYISPETLLSNTDITTFVGDRQIGLLVVDEAHTVATWGKNFRPDYWYLGDYLNKLRHSTKHIFPIATFTATATIGNGTDDMYHDIIDSLNMTPISFIGNVKRKNIEFDIRVCKKDHAYEEEKDQKVIDTINSYLDKNEKTLIYFPFVSKLNSIFDHLDSSKVGKYYGGLDKADKNETLDNIRIGKSNIVLATKAFGMGIDVPDIKNVYHFAPTGNLADYVQEIGRAARKPEMIGIASTDYYREDFRYINKLYGMSAITNYNIIGVLQKILYKYRQCKKRNFLVSTEEFAHVFVAQDDADIENKLKATILAIKKDFIKISNYVPLIFKPRSMFTKGLFYIPDSKLDYIRNIGWDKYITKRYDRKELQKTETSGTSYSYMGDVYELDFKQCWEDRYNNLSQNGLSFGAFKRKFFTVDDKGINELKINKNAFLDRMVLEINSKYGEDFNNICNKAYVFLDKINESLDDLKIRNKHFTIKDFAEIVCNKLTNNISISKMSAILDPLLNILISVDRNVTFGKAKFCEYNSKTDKYNIISSYYLKLINDIKNEIKIYFKDTLSSTQRTSLIDSTKDSNKKMRKNMLLVAVQVLELFDLINYSLKNGDRPEFFIRVNSEKAILKILENKGYNSQTLEAIKNLHYSSVDYMAYFFEKLNNNEQRWEFIEDYFLGVDLHEKYGIGGSGGGTPVPEGSLKKLKIYTIDGEYGGRYYISDKEIQLSYPAIKLSKDCEVAKHLVTSEVGTTFKVNQYEYTVINIEYHEI